MGAWGTGFYSDDTTCDVRDTYKHHLRMKHTQEEAAAKVVEMFQPDSSDDGYLVWLALADTQWRLGHLTEPLKEKCLAILDSGVAMEIWIESASVRDQKKRREVLEQLRARLSSPQPAPKKVAPYRGEKPIWKIGDFVSIRLGSIEYSVQRAPHLYGPEWLPFHGKYGVLHVVGMDYQENVREEVTNEHAVVAVLDWIGNEPITAQELEQPLPVVPSYLARQQVYYFFPVLKPIKWDKEVFELKVVHHSDRLPVEWGDPMHPMRSREAGFGTLGEMVAAAWIRAGKKAP